MRVWCAYVVFKRRVSQYSALSTEGGGRMLKGRVGHLTATEVSVIVLRWFQGGPEVKKLRLWRI